MKLPKRPKNLPLATKKTRRKSLLYLSQSHPSLKLANTNDHPVQKPNNMNKVETEKVFHGHPILHLTKTRDHHPSITKVNKEEEENLKRNKPTYPHPFRSPPLLSSPLPSPNHPIKNQKLPHTPQPPSSRVHTPPSP